MVYFVRIRGLKPVKIGETEDLDKRLRNIQTDSPNPVDLIGYMPHGNRSTERQLHEKFAPYRVINGGTEWFNIPEQELQSFADRHLVK